MFAIIGTVTLIFAIYNADLKWFVFGAATLFYTKSVRSFLIGWHAKSTPSERRLPTAKDWRIIMSGYVISSVFFLISGLAREGWLGFLAAPVLLLSSFTFWLIAKRTEKLQNERVV
jgi:hypothetical protein